MERSLFRYVFHHTWRSQVLLLIVTALSFPLIYINLAIPKEIVNNAIGGKHIPKTVLGFDVTQISYLMLLSLLLLALITLNGVIKYWLNVYSGVIGERALRRLRHDLYQQVLRFPLPQFKTMSSGEIIPMVVAETDPIGGFIGESISLPAFQGGLLVTYMVFIFMQDFWLGLAAVALYPPQVWLIPRLQKKINQLSKERVQQARALSDRIGETVAGAAEIRGNDTFHRERADISDRLGKIYAIRFDVFKRKFFVKFLNNFLGQITPFFFYSVGGYLVIKGQLNNDPKALSIGALVAVLAAYKDILAPWKELLTWYSTKEDVRIKYEQIISQFEPTGLLDAKLVETAPAKVELLKGEIVVAGLTYSEDGATRVDRASFNIAAGEHVALVGGGHSGKDDVTHLVARLVFASGGRLAVAGQNFLEVHQAVPGRRIAYATQNAYVFSGPLSHNLYYGLMHQPLRPATYDEAGAKREEVRIRDALISGNSPDDVRADWIDYEAAGVADSAALTEVALVALRRVEMEHEVIGFGLASTADPHAHPSLATMSLEARARMRDRVQSRDLASFVELFDPTLYHSNISVAENLLFGTPRSRSFQPDNLPGNPEFVALLREVGLLEDLYAVGVKVAGIMVELFADVAPDSDLFDQYSFISAEDLPEFRVLLSKIHDESLAATSSDEKARLLAVTFRLVAAQHRLGVIDEDMQRKVVAARAEFRRRYNDRDDIVEFFDPDRFSSALSIQDNILFGRVALEQANAQGKVNALVREVAGEVGMNAELVRLGLQYEVGNGGSRLSYSQRQRLAIARAMMKNPDIVVFNEPTSGLDPGTEVRVMSAVLEWAKGRTVVWALGRADLARSFDRVLVFEDGRLVEQGTFAELERPESHLSRLLG